jgi:chromosome segregation ATPase
MTSTDELIDDAYEAMNLLCATEGQWFVRRAAREAMSRAARLFDRVIEALGDLRTKEKDFDRAARKERAGLEKRVVSLERALAEAEAGPCLKHELAEERSGRAADLDAYLKDIDGKEQAEAGLRDELARSRQEEARLREELAKADAEHRAMTIRHSAALARVEDAESRLEAIYLYVKQAHLILEKRRDHAPHAHDDARPAAGG